MQIKKLPDKKLISAILILLLFGWIMSFSATVFYFESYSYFIKQTFFIFISLIIGAIILMVPIFSLKKYSGIIFIVSIALLAMTLLPIIGYEINNSARWINLYYFKFQPSELMKLAMILFMARYLAIQEKHIHQPTIGFIKTLGIITLGCFFIVLEPDYGATLIISLSAIAMIFAAGGYIKQILLSAGISVLGVLIFMLFNENRWLRLTSFWQGNLWENSANSVFQTKQALIGIARGEWFGTGLGAGIQKYQLLPERHTDMIFALIGEELGIFGMLFVIIMLLYIIIKGLSIAQEAIKKGKRYSSYVAFGICILFSMQTMINIGMNIALLPPKGFTLPLISYGGSSLLFTVISLAIILRIDMENKERYSKEKKYV